MKQNNAIMLMENYHALTKFEKKFKELLNVG